MKKFVFIIFALFCSNVSWGGAVTHKDINPCDFYSDYKNDDHMTAYTDRMLRPTTKGKKELTTITPTRVDVYLGTSWEKAYKQQKGSDYTITIYPVTKALFKCGDNNVAFLVEPGQCLFTDDKKLLCSKKLQYSWDKPGFITPTAKDCDGNTITYNKGVPPKVQKWTPNGPYEYQCPIIETNESANAKSKGNSSTQQKTTQTQAALTSQCFPISGKVPFGNQYKESTISTTQSPAYLQCGGSAKDNAQCKDKDEVAGKDGYIYMCLNNAWEKIDDNNIERCNPSPDANAGRNDIIPEDKNSPFVYEVVYYAGGTKIQNRCKYSREDYEKYKNDTNNNGGRFLGLGVCEKPDAQSSNLTSKSTIPYGKSGLTCNSTSSKNPNECTINHVVSSSDGNVYKCTPNGWVILNNTDITLCQDNIETLEKNYRFNGSNTWSIYDKKVETPEWIYFYESVPGAGCDPAIKIHCKYSTSKYKQEETECETQGGEFLTYGKNDDKDTFYKCYTNNVSPIEITVTDNNNNPLSMVTVIYRDIERTTNSAGQVTLPMVANRKEYDVTFKKDGFVNQTVREDVLYSKPTIILNGSSNSSTTTEQPTITTNSEINCTNTGGTSLDGNGNCICNPDEHLVEYKYNEEYSVCRCMNGYHRNGEPNADGKYKATGECIPANDYETTQVPNTEKYRQDAENAYRNEYDNAQSWANKGVTGLSTLMTGEGAKMAAQAWAEQIADRDAETEMADYLAGMRCGYGNGTTLNIGNEDITLPGGNELANYYAEYKTLADKLKTTKAALNLRSGIEAEVLYDRAETGLYQYKIAEIQSGSTPSLSRALMDGESADATAWNAQKTATQNKLITGGVLAATGVVAGYAANQYVNRNHENKYKDLIMTFTEIKKELQIKYPEAFVPEEIPVTPVTEEPIIATIEEILPVIEQPQQATQLDLEPFSDKYLFASGSYKLKNNVSALDDYIQKVIDTLNRPEYADFKICIQIDGHTDRVPPKPGFMSNQALSQKRADSVKDYLDAKLGSIKTHISNITSTGHGEEQCTKDEYKINDDRCRKIDIAIEACNN